jgi:[acyl-carrier-protein] S-malonyltransferase
LIRVGVVFPGQGSQTVGMGADVAAQSQRAQDRFDRAADVLGYDLLALQIEGPDEKLRETQYSQPAIFATNVALYAAVGEDLQPTVSAGHSFGEICSLVAANALRFEDAVKVVDERARAMQAAAELAPGGMSAVLGFDVKEIERIVNETNAGPDAKTDGSVALANFNAPSQIVISGDLAAVQKAGEKMLEAGAKRIVPLNVSGAWHSELMRPAVERFAKAVQNADLRIPEFDVVSNVDAEPYRDVGTIRDHLVKSIVSQVRWHDTATKLLGYGLDLVIEFGAGGVLGPLMKRMPGAPEVVTVSDFAGVEKVRGRLAKANA